MIVWDGGCSANVNGLPPSLAGEICSACPADVLDRAEVALAQNFHVDDTDPTCDGMLPHLGTNDYALATMQVRGDGLCLPCTPLSCIYGAGHLAFFGAPLLVQIERSACVACHGSVLPSIACINI